MASSNSADIRVSVIVPMYKAAPFVDSLMDSVLNQTFSDFELICINDGSPDNTLGLLQKWEAQDSRIVLINKEKNEGVSAARNAGIEAARGEYIWFHDCDDWAYPDTPATMFGEIGSRDFLITDFINTKKPDPSAKQGGGVETTVYQIDASQTTLMRCVPCSHSMYGSEHFGDACSREI